MRATAMRLLLFALLALPAGASSAASFVVHLPSTPVENAARRAEAIQQLTDALNRAVPDLQLEPQIFRRFADAEAFINANDDVVLLLSDAAWAAGPSADLEPGYSLVRNGQTTFKRQLVAKSASGAVRLADLRSQDLAIVASSASDLAFIRDRVFAGELDPGQWFRSLRPAVDDAEAVADVLYGDAQAGLVAEFNPLLAQHLGQSLKLIYTSGDLPLPVLSTSSKMATDQRRALGQALEALDASLLSGLGFEAFTAIGSAGRDALLRAPSQTAKRFELPTSPAAILDPLPPLDEALLPLVIELAVPEPPSAAGELLAGEAGLE